MTQDFAALLRAAIIKSGKSQYALAKETGVSQGRISDFLNEPNVRRLRSGSRLGAIHVLSRTRKTIIHHLV